MTININQVGNASQGNISVTGATAEYLLACIKLVSSGESTKVVVNSGPSVGAINGTVEA